MGIAATGTIVLDAGPAQGRRALTLVPDHHICVMFTDQIVDTVPQAFANGFKGGTEPADQAKLGAEDVTNIITSAARQAGQTRAARPACTPMRGRQNITPGQAGRVGLGSTSCKW